MSGARHTLPGVAPNCHADASKAGPAKRVLYVFADETGDDRFDERGTTYFGIAAVMTATPLASAVACQRLVYDFLADGVSRRGDRDQPIVALHATDDPPVVRERVFEMINEALTGIEVHIAYLDKRKMNPSIRGRAKMYHLVAGALAKYVARRAKNSAYERVVFAFDQMLGKKDMSAFKQAVKPELKSIGIPFTLVFHQLGHEPNGQISDYIAWAWSRNMERGDPEPLRSMPRLSDERRLTTFDLYRRGDTRYYGS